MDSCNQCGGIQHPDPYFMYPDECYPCECGAPMFDGLDKLVRQEGEPGTLTFADIDRAIEAIKNTGLAEPDLFYLVPKSDWEAAKRCRVHPWPDASPGVRAAAQLMQLLYKEGKDGR